MLNLILGFYDEAKIIKEILEKKDIKFFFKTSVKKFEDLGNYVKAICVQDPGTHSPRHSDPRLLATPSSCRRVAACNPNWDLFYEIRSESLLRFPLFRPL